MKQNEIKTSVQWLICQIDEDAAIAYDKWEEIKKTALELEKLQLYVFYISGNLESKYSTLMKRKEDSFEDYYNKQFNH